MKKKITIKKVTKPENTTCSWFDTENARLIILCALFGVFGVHKFAQKKIFQGICFILLDLTIIGLVVSWLWAFFGLLALTIKKDNKPGNVMFGTAFIVLVPMWAMIGFNGNTISKSVSVEKANNWEKEIELMQKKISCFSYDTGADFDASVIVYGDRAEINIAEKTFVLKHVNAFEKDFKEVNLNDFEKTQTYQGWYDSNFGKVIWAMDPDNETVLKLRWNRLDRDWNMFFSGSVVNGKYDEYKCGVVSVFDEYKPSTNMDSEPSLSYKIQKLVERQKSVED